MSVEYLLARLTAQSSGPRPKEPGGGKPILTREDIAAMAGDTKPMSYHALMTKYCQDSISDLQLRLWLHKVSLDEWFRQPEHHDTPTKASQLKRLPELAILGWANPKCPHALAIGTRAVFTGCTADIFKRNYQKHYAFLLRHLDGLEYDGLLAVYRARKGDDYDDA